MPEDSQCTECGAALPPNWPKGLCSACALLGALELPPSATDPEGDRRAASVTEKVGDRIGRYKLLKKIGEGGCGVVYMAEQEEPVRRRVALKVIKPGMDTHEVIARFEAERQALALMDHPHIAKVFDGGATATGRPYFVMELVRGLRITEYCDRKNLSTRQRLDLFMQVCQAVQHAHQKGIIHRDLKPSNILVTVNDGVPVPKVIDFGIAKATGQALTDKTFFTAFQQIVGTPAYMSPEQADMTSVDIDTRSDIYSLGVLLYELLTSRTPFNKNELLRAGLEEMLRTIREKEPVRPSARLKTLVTPEQTKVAQQRQTDLPKLINLVRGDLDWIVMKCLEKDRSRRYATTNELVMDVLRHLKSEPLVTGPPTSFYRFQKLVRRNRLAFATAGAVGAVGVIFLWLHLRVTDTRDEAIAIRKIIEYSSDITFEFFRTDDGKLDTTRWQESWKMPGREASRTHIIDSYFEGWVNRGNTAVADKLIATNLVLHDPPLVIHGLEDYKTAVAKFRAAFPDARYTIQERIAEGDKVVVRWTLRATQAHEYQGQATNGKTMMVTGVSVFRIKRVRQGGKIHEIDVSMDRLGQMEQLGWLPAPLQPPLK
jgi:serine/threonine protein kinase/predicted ester cyclase